MESRENFAKGPEELQKAVGEGFFLRFRRSLGRRQGHFADLFREAAVQVPASYPLEFLEREIRHAEPLPSRRIPSGT